MVSPVGTTFLDSMQNFYHLEVSANQAIYRSNPVHFGGAYLRSRLYGGQTVAQMFLVLRKAYPECLVSSLSVNFTSAGNVTEPVFFKPNLHKPGFCALEAQQSGKIIGIGSARLVETSSELLYSNSIFPNQVSNPRNYSSLTQLIKETKYQSRNYENIAMNLLFEIHPVDPLHFIGESDKLKPNKMWCRIRHTVDLKDFHFGNEPLGVVILLTDFMVAHPAKIACTRLQALEQMTGAASLTHKLVFHRSLDDIDPLGFFLVENDVEKAHQLILQATSDYAIQNNQNQSKFQISFMNISETFLCFFVVTSRVSKHRWNCEIDFVNQRIDKLTDEMKVQINESWALAVESYKRRLACLALLRSMENSQDNVMIQ
uniref:Uncharacterized protein n=1 Tax=Ditylenchus dipsaci TaxID=166011 RepID=A0A915EGM9_9BILA